MPRLLAAAGTLCRLRQRPARPRRHPHRPALRDLRQRLSELLSDDADTVHPRLQPLHDNLANHERSNTVLAWLNKDTLSAILRELAAGQRALTHATHGQATAVQQHVRAAIALLDWLTACRLELVTAGQGDLDTWLTGQPASRREAGHFVRWAKRHK